LANVLDVLEQRGFIYQMTADSPEEKAHLRSILQEQVACYIGFDPTSSSLHVGSLVPIMSLVHMQRHGHRPIALVGGGTGLIGDPSGKTEMRKLLTREEIKENAEGIRAQLSTFIDFEDERALLLNNADWLTSLNYIDVLRDIGKHFSVNRMLNAESIRQGLVRGLSFIEFNYMILQAYDFWYLFRHYDCRLQMGGNDQWGNILAGADLTRRGNPATTSPAAAKSCSGSRSSMARALRQRPARTSFSTSARKASCRCACMRARSSAT